MYNGLHVHYTSNFKVKYSGPISGLRVSYTLNPSNWTNTDVTITITANSSEVTISTPTGLTKNEDGTYKASENGIYKFLVTDSNGNEKEREVIIDKIDKVSPFAFTATAIYTSTGLKIKANAQDNEGGSGIASYEYHVGDNTYTSNEGTKLIEGLGEGTDYTIYVIAIDKVGNRKQSAQVDVVTSDGILYYPIITKDGIVNRIDDNMNYYLDTSVNAKANDAITGEAYDGDDETNMIIHAGYNNCTPRLNQKYMLISPDAYGLEISIKWYCWNWSGYIAYINLLDSNNEVLDSISINEGKTQTDSITIPEGSIKLQYSMNLSDDWWSINSRIYEIKLEPQIKIKEEKMEFMVGETKNAILYSNLNTTYVWTSSNTSIATVTQEGKITAIKNGYAEITCEATVGESTYSTSTLVAVKKPGTIMSYPIITGEKIVNIIKQDGTYDTDIARNCSAEDTITTEAYDGNYETNMIIHGGYNNCIEAALNEKYMLIDSSAWGKELEVKWFCWYWSGYISYINFLDSDNEVLDSISVSGGVTRTNNIVIPEGSVKLQYSMHLSGSGWDINSRIYEISIKN